MKKSCLKRLFHPAKSYFVKNQADELNKVKKRKAEVDRLFAKMYEDWANERITEYNFNMMSQKFQTEQQELDVRIENLETEPATEKETVDNAKMDCFDKEIFNSDRTDRRTLELIDRKNRFSRSNEKRYVP